MEINAVLRVDMDVPDDALRELAADVITTAVEGGIGHWADVRSYRWGNALLGHSDRMPWTEDDKPYARVSLRDTEADEPAVYILGETEIVAVLIALVNGSLPEFANEGYSQTFRTRLINAMCELGHLGGDFSDTELDYDADDADCLVQLACLGEVAYS